MTRLSLNNALKLAKLRADALGEKSPGFVTDVVTRIAKLGLPREHVRPVIEELARRKGVGSPLIAHYMYQSKFYLPVPSAVEVSDSVTFNGVDLDALMTSTPRFPIETLFAKLRIAERAAGGFYIKPCFPGDGDETEQVNWVQNGSPADEQVIGCEDDDPERGNGDYLKDYLEKGHISLDDLRILGYDDPLADESEVSLPEGVYEDDMSDTRDLHILQGLTSLRVCNYCYPIAEIVDETGEARGVQIKFLDVTGWRAHALLNKVLDAEGAAMFQELSDEGLRVNADDRCRTMFRKIVKSGRDLPRVTQYSQPGWHGERFVLPTGVAVDRAGPAPALVARECATVDSSSGGSFEAWWLDVGSQIWTGETPQFCAGLLAGAAGAVTKLLRADHPVVHFSGPPSTGKSTAQIIGAGLTANPEPGRGTLVTLQGAVDETLPKGLGTSAHIDDPTKRGSPRHVERLMYQATEMTPFTVSSVASLEQIVEAAGSRMDEGIRRRVITVDTSKVPRIDFKRADRIKQAALANYGHVMPRIAAELIRQGMHQDPAPLRQIVDDYVDGLPGVTDSEAYCAAKLIGTLHAVGIIMADAQLIPEGADGGALLQGLWNDWLARRNATPAARGAEDLLRALHDPEAAPALGLPGEGI
jgi:Domain of unknown function (DUF927)